MSNIVNLIMAAILNMLSPALEVAEKHIIATPIETSIQHQSIDQTIEPMIRFDQGEC